MRVNMIYRLFPNEKYIIMNQHYDANAGTLNMDII